MMVMATRNQATCWLFMLLLVALFLEWNDQIQVLNKLTEHLVIARYDETAMSSRGFREEQRLLPDWRIVTDCSTYAVDCVMQGQVQGRYKEYPFQFTSQNIANYEWNELNELPETWRASLESFDSTQKLNISSYYEFPPEKEESEVKKCLRIAKKESFSKQLDLVLAKLDRSLDNKVCFTISDYHYAHDMIHDVFQMAWDVVEFPKSFFMVALDKDTVELACRYGYPVLAFHGGIDDAAGTTSTLRSKVQNAKFDVSKALVDQHVSFFFFEMDVFFIKSPRPWLVNQTADIIFASHQNNPNAPNIGAYSVLANDASQEYFRYCIEWSTLTPSTHDQLVMSNVWWASQNIENGGEAEFGDEWNPKPPQPKFQNKFKIQLLGPHHIVSSEWIIPTEETIAVHPLCGAPLRDPHGKKWVAKELGAWYGYRSPNGIGGYYHRQGNYRRYLWMDGRALGGYSMVQGDAETGGWGRYHDERSFRFTIATVVALARRTHRILVLPKIIRDRGVYLLWTELDLKSLENLVEFRETNYFSNFKSWHSPTVPVVSVARTALGGNGHLFAEYNNVVKTWKAPDVQSGIDVLFAAATEIPEIAEAEALLFNPHFVEPSYLDRLIFTQGRSSNMEKEIMTIYEQLKWCNNLPADNVASVTVSEWDCYGKGVNISTEAQ